ncbi:MAG: DUF4333 domain-containing protein [Actinobacteria bacterium]|nr:DUF4333 domain-containing protein [Actinomycetota bacterium]
MSAAKVAVVLALALGGCSRRPDLDMAAARREIRRTLVSTYGADVDLGQPRCPARVVARKGERFRCSIDVAGQRLGLSVEQRDDAGTLQVVPERAVVGLPRVRRELVAALADRIGGRSAVVSCAGPAVRVVAVGATFECAARDGATTRTVLVRVRDLAGSLTFTIQR